MSSATYRFLGLSLTARMHFSDTGWERDRCPGCEWPAVARGHSRTECRRNKVSKFFPSGEKIPSDSIQALLCCSMHFSDLFATAFSIQVATSNGHALPEHHAIFSGNKCLYCRCQGPRRFGLCTLRRGEIAISNLCHCILDVDNRDGGRSGLDATQERKTDYQPK